MKIVLFFLASSTLLLAQTIALPERPSGALSGNAVAAELKPLNRIDRERRIFSEIVSGNVPSFLRSVVPIVMPAEIHGETRSITIFVLPDYLSIGNDSDYLYIPMTPILAQRLADTLRSLLPTSPIVDRIYQMASIKLPPQPIPPDSLMTGVPRFIQHNDSVRALLPRRRSAALTAGHKKDIILHAKMFSELRANRPKPVVIYGWHRPDGTPIQPPNNWHQNTYADYSHGVRLVAKQGVLDGETVNVTDILKDTVLHKLLSDTPLPTPYYDTDEY